MFQPFLLDTICARRTDDFSVDEIQQEFLDRQGLSVPRSSLVTLLERARRDGFVQRVEGKYIRDTTVIKNPDIATNRQIVEREHAALALQLRQYAATKNRAIATDEEALTLLLEFLEENQLVLLLDDPNNFDLTPSPSLGQRDAVLVARFIAEHCLADPDLSAYLQRMLEGFVLQNALLLRDLSTVGRRFKDLTVFFDSRFLFGVLGLHGAAIRQAARESIDLFRAAQVNLAVFEITIDEMKRVLGAYERHLGSSDGVRHLFPGLLTKHFVSQRYTPSDIRVATGLLEHNIRGLGIQIRSVPKHNPESTLNEEDLSTRIAGSDPVTEQRVVHDVDCIAGILTLRQGKQSDSWDTARYVFATTTPFVIRQAVEWYRSEKGRGVPPVIHVLRLSNIAWLKRPSSAGKLKLNELVALCSAALRPSRPVWDLFIRHLRKLEEQGTLNSDEAVAIAASELTEKMLLDVEEEHPDDEALDATTLTEIVERVRKAYQDEADERVKAAKKSAQETLDAANRTADRRIAELEAQAGEHAERNRQMELRVNRYIDLAAAVIAAFLMLVVGLVVAASAAITVSQFKPSTERGQLLVWSVVSLVALIGLFRWIFGGSLIAWFVSLREWIRRMLRRTFLPEHVS